MRVIACAMLSAVGAAGYTSLCGAGGGWSEVWRDDFNGNALNETAWTILVEHNNSRVRDACGTRESIAVANGNLVITSDRGTAPGCPYNYTTGAIQTQNKVFWRGHTRACVRAKLPGSPGKAAGVWPAHWMLPNTNVCWPMNGEIDILEMIDGDSQSRQTYHWDDTACSRDSSHGGAVRVENWDTDFQEYAVEYNATHLTFFTNGAVVKQVTSADATLYDVPYYMILQTALGGGWPGPVKNTTVFPIQHVVDSVIVMQKH